MRYISRYAKLFLISVTLFYLVNRYRNGAGPSFVTGQWFYDVETTPLSLKLLLLLVMVLILQRLAVFVNPQGVVIFFF
jgi:hypothetical protein